MSTSPDFGALPLNVAVAPGGYAWWYFDGESDCGKHGICIIAFVGSVFSPHYARACRSGAANPYDHTAFNVVLYGKRPGWVFSEQPTHPAQHTATCLNLRRNALQRTPEGFVVDIDEQKSPGIGRLRGQVRFCVQSSAGRRRALDPTCCHHWWPVAPACRIEVDFAVPQLQWQGRGYHDVNWGSVPLATSFSAWSWLRALHPDGTLVHYAPDPLPGVRAVPPWGTLYRYDGRQQSVELPAPQRLPRSHWGLRPACHGKAKVIDYLEDTPFYMRARIALPWRGKTLVAMYEYLNLQRWQASWVQFLVAFRLRRHRRAAKELGGASCHAKPWLTM